MTVAGRRDISFLLLVAFLALLFAAGTATARDQTEGRGDAGGRGGTDTVVIGGGRPFGLYFAAAGAVCRIFMRAEQKVRCLVESNGDSSSNIAALSKRRIDFAIVQSDWLYHAAHGTSRFRSSGPDRSLRAVFSLHAESLALVVRSDDAVKGLRALDGRPIAAGREGSYERLLTKLVLGAVGLDGDGLRFVRETAMEDSIAALCAGRVAAAAFVIAHPSARLAALSRRCAIRVLPLRESLLAHAVRRRPGLSLAKIPADLYQDKAEDLSTVGLRAVLATSERTPPALVYRLVKAVLENLDALRGQHPVLRTLEGERMIRAGIAVPLHAGARRYYREQGWLDR